MAYADGKLDPQTGRKGESTLGAALVQRIASQRTPQSCLHASFAPLLENAVPQRLLDAAGVEPTADAAPNTGPHWLSRLRAVWKWGTPFLLALAFGTGAFVVWLFAPQARPMLTTPAGRMLANGILDKALTQQTGGSEPAESGMAIGLSYLSKGGSYCRTFTMKQSESIAGLACREADGWHIQVLAQTGPQSPLAQYRMAGTLVPPLILGAVENTIDGNPLDAQAAAAARAANWRSDPIASGIAATRH